jgi:zinc protease
MAEKLIKTILDNGLKVMLKEIHSAPIITHWVWYRVGSRNEIPGLTGISHWVEHMQFKGTPKYPAGVLDKEISRDGGYWNAFTYIDWTAFYTTMPADKIWLPIDLEADRMQNSLYLPEEVDSERTVIISEREGSENEPMFRLEEAIAKAAFMHHPYGVEVIGEKEDLLKISRDDLFRHYRSYYAPNNAVLAMAGDFNAEKMLDHLKKVYQDIPAREIPDSKIKPEGFIQGEKRIEISGPGDVTYLNIVWRAPQGSSRDFFPLVILDSILTGPRSLNMFGGGSIPNKTSRLYRSLVESQIAVAFSGDYVASIDPYLFTISVIMNPDHSVAEALDVIDSEIQRIKDGDIQESELQRAAKQARALFAYGCDNITNQGYWLGYSEMFDSYSWFENFVSSLEKVSKEDVINIANQYLGKNQRVIGVYTPSSSETSHMEGEMTDEFA